MSRTLDLKRWAAAVGLAIGVATATAPAGRALDFKVVNSADAKSVTLELSGPFAPGDGLKLRAHVLKLPEVDIVAHLNAAGGSTLEAMSVGRLFHQLGVRTVIPPKARCISPCPFAFLGGYNRASGQPALIVHSSATFGFSPFLISAQERSYSAKDLVAIEERTYRDILQVADYLVEMEAELGFLRPIYDDGAGGSVALVSNEDLLSLGVSIFDDDTKQLIDAKALRLRLRR